MIDLMRSDEANRYFYEVDPDDLVSMVARAVDKACRPWPSGRIEVFHQSDLQYDQIRIEVGLLYPGQVFVYPVDYRDAGRLSPAAFARKVAEAAFAYFRNRPALPIDDHIVLGED